jgi:hypothetical protein
LCCSDKFLSNDWTINSSAQLRNLINILIAQQKN